MKYTAAALTFASVALAASPMIPSGISAKCSTFLNTLDTDSSLNGCTSSLFSATSLFSPSSSTPVTASTIKSSLGSICSAGCSSSVVKSALSDFTDNCLADLSSSEAVKSIYDVLYILVPLQSALCSQDGSGNYCALAATTNSSVSTSTLANKSSAQIVLQYLTVEASSIAASTRRLARRAFRLEDRAMPGIQVVGAAGSSSPAAAQSSAAAPASSAAAAASSAPAASSAAASTPATTSSSSSAYLMPNSTTFLSSGLPFLFLNTNAATSTVCTTCTKNILGAYIQFEMQQPYPLGLAQNSLLGGQGALWTALGNKCGSGFTTSIEDAAGAGAFSGASSLLKSGSLLSIVAAAATIFFTLA